MPEVIMIVGYHASGKTSKAQEFIDQGYVHVNRDKAGGKIIELVEPMAEHLKAGKSVVLDNTFPTVDGRSPFIAMATSLGVKVRCFLMMTTIEEAQFNFCRRMVQKFGKCLLPEEVNKTKSPNIFPPAAMFGYRKRYEAPSLDEGFESIEKVPYVRVLGPEYVNKAIILDYDGTLRTSSGQFKYPADANDVVLIDGASRGRTLVGCQSNGYMLLGVSNQSGVAKGVVTDAGVDAAFKKTNEMLGLDIEYLYDATRIPPMVSWGRKPMPGLGVVFIEKYKLDPAQCIMVGDQTSDKTFAKRCGFQFEHADKFFD